MLVLTRKNGQKIQIGDDITITVLRIKGRSVRVGIDAPEDVRIVRSELPPRTDLIDLDVDEPCEVELPRVRPAHADDTADRRENGCRPGSTDASRGHASAKAQGERRCRLWSSAPPSTSAVRMPARMSARAVGSLRTR